MGVRGEKNMHYKLGEITLRHWLETAKRNGLSDVAESIIEKTISDTPVVIETVRAQLPGGFPASVRDKIFASLGRASKEIAGHKSYIIRN
jgi:serine/threonine-protein kinase HipA